MGTPAFEQDGCRIFCGDCIEVMRSLPSGCVRACVTSPPYFGLRDYGVDGQIGLEPTPEQYVAKMVDVFREVRRVLADDGTCWINIGDSYAPNWSSRRDKGGGGLKDEENSPRERWTRIAGFKPKDLIGIPWRVAFALQADGWYLRQDIIWHKPNPMPESVTDRCTKAHEYLFLLAKSERYYFDAGAIAEPTTDLEYRTKGKIRPTKFDEPGFEIRGGLHNQSGGRLTRNRRSVWTITPKPYQGAHFATFPTELVEPCIVAGSELGDTVLDPFNGSGTTGHVCREHGRRYIGIELNPKYVELTKDRLVQQVLFSPTEAA